MVFTETCKMLILAQIILISALSCHQVYGTEDWQTVMLILNGSNSGVLKTWISHSNTSSEKSRWPVQKIAEQGDYRSGDIDRWSGLNITQVRIGLFNRFGDLLWYALFSSYNGNMRSWFAGKNYLESSDKSINASDAIFSIQNAHGLEAEISLAVDKSYGWFVILSRDSQNPQGTTKFLFATDDGPVKWPGIGYLGCHRDNETRDMVFLHSGNSLTLESCISSCRQAAYAYAGMQVGSPNSVTRELHHVWRTFLSHVIQHPNGDFYALARDDKYARECYCGDKYGVYGRIPEDDCFYSCAGNQSQTCGGDYANSVYDVEDIYYQSCSDCNTKSVYSFNTTGDTTLVNFNDALDQSVYMTGIRLERRNTSISERILNYTLYYTSTGCNVQARKPYTNAAGEMHIFEGFSENISVTTHMVSTLKISCLWLEFVSSVGASDTTVTVLGNARPFLEAAMMAVQIQRTYPETKTCVCQCRKNNITAKVMQEKLAILTKTLTIPKKNLSSRTRKYISVIDDRPSAKSVGYIGIMMLVITFGLIVFLDLTSLIQAIGSLKAFSIKWKYEPRVHRKHSPSKGNIPE